METNGVTLIQVSLELAHIKAIENAHTWSKDGLYAYKTKQYMYV